MAREEFETSTPSLLDAGTTGDRRVEIAAHSPLPWSVSTEGKQYACEVVAKSKRGKTIVVARVAGGAEHRDANAAFIVRAVNAHDELVAALKASAGYLHNAQIDLSTGCPKATALRTIEGGLKIVEAALAKATSTGK